MKYPDVHFGAPAARPMSWQSAPDDDPDDEPREKTPPAIVAVLGFDPLDDE